MYLPSEPVGLCSSVPGLGASLALALTNVQSASEENLYALLITNLIQNEMMFPATRFFLLVAEMNRLKQSGWYGSILLRYLIKDLTGQSNKVRAMV